MGAAAASTEETAAAAAASGAWSTRTPSPGSSAGRGLSMTPGGALALSCRDPPSRHHRRSHSYCPLLPTTRGSGEKQAGWPQHHTSFPRVFGTRASAPPGSAGGSAGRVSLRARVPQRHMHGEIVPRPGEGRSVFHHNLRVIVTPPAVIPRLVEPLHLDVQSAGQDLNGAFSLFAGWAGRTHTTHPAGYMHGCGALAYRLGISFSEERAVHQVYPLRGLQPGAGALPSTPAAADATHPRRSSGWRAPPKKYFFPWMFDSR